MLKDIISKNRYRGDIQLAIKLQNEASFYISYDPSNYYDKDFKKRVLGIYAGDTNKQKRFLTAYLGDIIPSVELTETIYSQLSRVYDSQDPSREYNFKTADLNSEAVEFISKFNPWWRNDWWLAYQHQFCSFIVVDLPEDQGGSFRPDPYPFILDISDVLYLDLTSEGKVREIIFKSTEYTDDKPSEYWYYYTDRFYSKYLIDGEDEILQTLNNHNLGRCPVHKVWNERLNKSSHILSRGAITPNHDDMFWYIFKTVESRKADLLYLNPIMQSPKLSCGFDGSKSTIRQHYTTFTADSKCSGGYLVSSTGEPIPDENGNQVLCPSCGTKRHVSGGAGNMIQIDLDATAIKEGKVNPADKLVQYITPEIQGIKEQFARIKELKDIIIRQSVGSEDQPTKSAVNEMQQTAIFESKEGVLKRISEGLSQIRTDVERDQFELRYGGQFISNRYSQGTKFFLYTVDELLERREKAKDPIQKRQIDEQIILVKFRNDQKKLNEEKLLYKLLPYNTLTDLEFTAQIGTTIIGDETINLRLQFSNAVELFESEYGPIVDYWNKFSDTISELTRIELLRNLLLKNIKISKYVQSKVS